MGFKPGNRANPKGRPPVGTSLAEYIRKLGGPDGKVYADKLHAIAVEPHKNVQARMTAIGILFDRGFGKTPQDVNLSGKVDTVTTVVHKHE
jgi:hypothetical protein